MDSISSRVLINECKLRKSLSDHCSETGIETTQGILNIGRKDGKQKAQ